MRHLCTKAFLLTTSGLFLGLLCVAAPQSDGAPDAATDRTDLIGKDQYGYPRIERKDMTAVANLALSAKTDGGLRYQAVWGLAISGYSPESADALIAVVENTSFEENVRDVAAMGLRNFTLNLDEESKEALKKRLHATILADPAHASDEMIRVLLTWGDAAWVVETLGEHLHGHPMEVEILSHYTANVAIPRLLDIYFETKQAVTTPSYNKRAEIGTALLDFKDKRGIDILASLLPNDCAPGNEYRNYVFNLIIKHVGHSFGYTHRNYDPSLEQAVSRFSEWWLRERYSFEFPESE